MSGSRNAKTRALPGCGLFIAALFLLLPAPREGALAQAPSLFDALTKPAQARKPSTRRPSVRRRAADRARAAPETAKPADSPDTSMPSKSAKPAAVPPPSVPAPPLPKRKPGADDEAAVAGKRVQIPADAWNDATRAAMFSSGRLLSLDDYPQLGARLRPSEPAVAESAVLSADEQPSASASAAGATTSVPLPRPKNGVPESAAPPPAQNVEADPDCADLQSSGVVGDLMPSMDSTPAGCGIPHPIRFTAIETSVGRVDLKPGGIMRCGAARAVAQWVRDDVVRLGKDLLSADLKALHTASSYVCRPRNHVDGAVLSEHGLGTALDVAAFEFADGKTLAVGGKDDDKGFVQAVRSAACKHLTTVLGPGSDAAHGNHLHVDLKIRKGGYRICQ